MVGVIIFFDKSGDILKSSKEAICYSRKIKKDSQKIVAICSQNIDNEKLSSCAVWGVDEVIKPSENLSIYSKDIMCFYKDAIEKCEIDTIVLSADNNGKIVGPKLSVLLKAGIISGVVGYPQSKEDNIVVEKSIFSGKATAMVTYNTIIKIIAISPNTFPIEETEKQTDIRILEESISMQDERVKIKECIQENNSISLGDADIVVSGGRGLKGPENWGMIEDLAELLGAATACSRPVADSEWRPHHEHVGQTGLSIKPNLYIAVGISGAIQHLAGVNNSKVIVVINTDADAPFFNAANYGIVGDAFEIVPKLIENIKTYK